MPATKKPRKKYRPGVRVALPMVFRHSGESDTMLKMIPHTELDKLRDGTADEYTPNTLAFRLNFGYVLSNEVFDNPEARAVMERGLAAIRAVKERHARLGRWGCSGEEFRALGEALNITDEMQSVSTRREQAEAQRILLAVNEDKRRGT